MKHEMRDGIVKRGAQSWAFVLELGRDADGRRKQKWITVKGTRKDALRERDRMRAAKHEGTFVEPAKSTVAKYLESWLRDYAQSNVSAKTRERYEEYLSAYVTPKIGSVVLSKLQPLHLQTLYTSLLKSGSRKRKGGLAPRTVLHLHRILYEALDRAVKWRLLSVNPAEAVEPPVPENKEARALTEEQTASLFKVVRERRYYIAVLLALTTGMRRGEICALRWQNVDLDKGVLAVVETLEQTKEGLRVKPPKTKKGRRRIPLPSVAVEELRKHKVQQAKERLMMGPGYEDNGLVFCNPDGTAYAPDSLTNTYSSMIRQSPKDYGLQGSSFHSLRHTHATRLLEQGVHVKIVSERLGHATVSITLDTYSHVLPGIQEGAIAQMDKALRGVLG